MQLSLQLFIVLCILWAVQYARRLSETQDEERYESEKVSAAVSDFKFRYGVPFVLLSAGDWCTSPAAYIVYLYNFGLTPYSAAQLYFVGVAMSVVFGDGSSISTLVRLRM
jgi:hypothetical protein